MKDVHGCHQDVYQEMGEGGAIKFAHKLKFKPFRGFFLLIITAYSG
jgi:sulfur transfer protein SufE